MTKLFDLSEGFAYDYTIKAACLMIFIAICFMVVRPATGNVASPQTAPTIEQPVENKLSVTDHQPILTAHDKRQIQCLAENAYFEAGNQTEKGKIAVTNVVMNRVDSGKFPRTPCAVVYQKTGRTCQFSWVCEGRKRIRDWEEYVESRKVAEKVYLNQVGDVTRGALFYHANYVNPRWRLRRVAVIGAHIFYRG